MSTAPVAPHIDDFPTEVLAHIFELRQDGGPYDGSILLQVASVCKHWKEVAFTHPQLWSTLQCELPSDTDSARWTQDVVFFVKRLARWFGRAGHIPLALEVTFTAMHDGGGRVLAEYLASCPKWRDLRFIDRRHNPSRRDKWRWMLSIILAGERRNEPARGNVCWPSLEALHIDVSGSVFDSEDGLILPLQSVAPNLHKLSLAVANVQTTTILSALQGILWSQLTEFTFHGLEGLVSPTFPLYVLEHAPELKRLEVASTAGLRWQGWQQHDTEGPTLYSDLNPLFHSNLQQLSLDFHIEFQESFFKKVRLPSVRSVEVKTSTFYSRSFLATLEDLCMDPEFWPNLKDFTYSSGECGFAVREGEMKFGMFKQGPLCWWGWMHGWRPGSTGLEHTM